MWHRGRHPSLQVNPAMTNSPYGVWFQHQSKLHCEKFAGPQQELLCRVLLEPVTLRKGLRFKPTKRVAAGPLARVSNGISYR